jgi:hypothetical protein
MKKQHEFDPNSVTPDRMERAYRMGKLLPTPADTPVKSILKDMGPPPDYDAWSKEILERHRVITEPVRHWADPEMDEWDTPSREPGEDDT